MDNPQIIRSNSEKLLSMNAKFTLIDIEYGILDSRIPDCIIQFLRDAVQVSSILLG